MGHHVDREMAQSQKGPDLETEAARQAYYIKWAEIFGIPDPCGYYEGLRIVAIYIKYVQSSILITSWLFVLQWYKDMPRRSTTFSNFDTSVHPPICPTQTI
jgi:hypothetical protein